VFESSIRLVAILIVVGFLVLGAFPDSTMSAPGGPTLVKELNIVFLHGAGGHADSFQFLTDSIKEKLPAFAAIYERANPNISIVINTLARWYPGYVDIDVWAGNIADSLKEHFGDKEDLILVGHSMGGKTALHMVAKNVGDVADRVAAVVTINSPIRNLSQYYAPAGGPVLEYYQTILLGADEGIARSVVYHDCSEEAKWVGENKNWLALVSAEGAPFSRQFDRAGVDAWPRDMDDGVVPISAQYSDGADTVYYGQHGHGALATDNEVASLVADRILRYLFGESIGCSVPTRSGSIEHKADWLLGTDHWDDLVGDVVAESGRIQHHNGSWKWQEWEDIIGVSASESQRSRTRLTQISPPFLTGVEELRWVSPEDIYDSRVYLKTRAAPHNTVQVQWAIYAKGLLPDGNERSHYEVKIADATPLATVTEVSWVTSDTNDVRLRLWSEAQSPFRWLKMEWQVYQKESRQRFIVDDIPAQPISSYD